MGSNGSEDLYTFHHLTFQEFLAAFYIHEAQLANVELIKEEKLHKVWKFYCGLILLNNRSSIDTTKLVFEKKTFLYNIQCAFESQQVELCDSAIRNDHIELRGKTISSTDFIALDMLSQSAERVNKISLIHCMWDSE